MAIGTAAAIGLGVAGVGSVISSSKSSKAAGRAADVSAQASQANTALARDIYGKNRNALAPFMQRGNAAGNQINALLGLGGAPAQQQAIQPNALSQFRGGPSPANYYGIGDGFSGFNPALARGIPSNYFQGGGGYQPAQPVSTQANPQQAAQNAFDIFRNSTGYQFRLGEALDSVSSRYAGANAFQSGAAIKALATRAGQEADNTFGQYLGALSNQQGVGLSGASALAGVGQNYANNVSFNNSQAASAQGNAALISGQNNFGNTLANIGGVLAGL